MRPNVILHVTRLDLLKRAREATAQKFANLDVFSQEGVSHEFDAYVQDKRTENRFESFDQRVEHAYQKAWTTHKAEIWNAHKRQVREGSLQRGLTPQVMTDINSKLDDRKGWLREVWAQIDADYRSGDESRVSTATAEIEQAHAKEGNAYMEWAYQTKYDMRFMGPKEREDMDNKLHAANFPEISDEEVNRYMNRRTSMNEVEEAVTERFGLAGRRHWDTLQQAKDDEYREKIDMAISIYEALKAKEDEAEEVNMRRSEKAFDERKERSKLRLKKALDREEDRKKMMDVDRTIDEKQQQEAFERRKKLLKNMMEMRDAGAQTKDVLNDFRRRSLADLQAKNNLQMQTDRSAVMEKKKRLFATMRRMQREANERSALAAMSPEGQSIAQKYSGGHAIAEKGSWEANELGNVVQANSDPLSRQSLWNLVHDKTYKTPATVIHQARVDARKTYSGVYELTRPHNLRNKRKMDWSKGYSGFESRFHHAYSRETKLSVWGMRTGDIHNLDPDGDHTYVTDRTGLNISDKETGDVSSEHSVKHDRGPKFKGDRYYKNPSSDIGRDN